MRFCVRHVCRDFFSNQSIIDKKSSAARSVLPSPSNRLFKSRGRYNTKLNQVIILDSIRWSLSFISLYYIPMTVPVPSTKPGVLNLLRYKFQKQEMKLACCKLLKDESGMEVWCSSQLPSSKSVR